MQRYFIYLKYAGSNYHGWQMQPNAPSVQEELQKALSLVLRNEVQVVGAGRTDTGVHARMMTAHFDSEYPIDGAQLTYRLNRILPRDIAVEQIKEVDEQLHARFSATSRTYHYYVHRHKDPFCRNYSWQMHYDLDFDKMNQAAALLLQYEDFAAFCKSNSDVKTTLCHVTEARWVNHGDGSWHFVITANRFLRNMVRAVVGTLIEVGRGRASVDDFRAIIEGKSRTMAGDSMPGHALFLERITY